MMKERERVDRPTGAACAHLAVVVALAALLGACAPGVPRASDPLVSASTGPPPLPPNVGPSGCQPPSPVDPLDGGPIEVHGAASAGASLWMKVVASRPLPADRDLAILWRIPGSSALHLVAVGPDGERVPASRVSPASAPAWDRPGDAWTSTLRFPSAGCWRINASRGQIHGDVWIEVA
jgi:hypothetical protein